MLISSALISIFLLLFFSWYKRKKFNSEETYLLAGKNTKLFPLVATLVMTELNPSTLIAFSGAGYYAGIWALMLPFVFLVGLGFYAFAVAKKWKEWDGYSVAGIFSKRYGILMGRVTSFLLLVAMVGFTATYVKAMYLIFSPLFVIFSQWQLTFIIVCLVLSLNLKGGLRSIIQTDIYSFLAVMIILPSILLFSFLKSDAPVLPILSPQAIVDGSKILPVRFILSLILLTMFTYIAAPWYGQKIVSSESKETAKAGVTLSAVFVFLLYCFPILSVILYKSKIQHLTSGQDSYPLVLNQVLPDYLLGFTYVVLFAIGATTLSGVWSAQTSMVIGDFFSKIEVRKDTRRAYLIMVVFAILSYIAANLLVDQILDKLILANIPVFALSFALLAGFYWEKASAIGAYISTLVGIVWGVFTYLYFGEENIYTFYWSVLGLPLIFGTGILFSYLFPSKKR
ncbi:hypothetical protein EHQ58_04870 [Leptospira ognonensis]|uniref:Sodium:solute symporter n=2 Tax=Leptospira ognonensis TaxID=2484945 RepID=A0A4V6QM78_9LEPT|nr:hypothetical protein EHQ58_04870 [Leptospira ognonensis]